MAAINTGSGSRTHVTKVTDGRSEFGPVLFRDWRKAGTKLEQIRLVIG